MEVSFTHFSRLLSFFKSLVNDTIFFDLNLSLGDDGILYHFASKFEIFFGSFLSNLSKLLLMILHVIVEVLLLFLLTVLFFHTHTFMKLSPTISSCRSSIKASLLERFKQEIRHLES